MSSVRIVANPQPPARPESGSVRPLTHHEILALMGPFTRRGLHADLVGSRRAERRLLFQPVDYAPTAEGLPLVREVLALEVPERGGYRLVRTLSTAAHGKGLQATLTAEGPDPERLLAEIDRIPPGHQLRLVEGVPVERSYRLEPPGSSPSSEGPWGLVLTSARALVRGVTVEVDAERDRGVALQVRLSVPPNQDLTVPEDLIAVLGRGFRPLENYFTYWRGTLGVPRQEPARTAVTEARLDALLAHLEQTLAQPPAAFHDRFRGARWGVSFRRGLPLLTLLGMIAATPAVGSLPLDEGTVLRMLIFHAPPLMLAALLLFSELPRIEFPPLPRALRQDGWVRQKH
jgi:hypothetical protein